jgi:hypothetical protein
MIRLIVIAHKHIGLVYHWLVMRCLGSTLLQSSRCCGRKDVLWETIPCSLDSLWVTDTELRGQQSIALGGPAGKLGFWSIDKNGVRSPLLIVFIWVFLYHLSYLRFHKIIEKFIRHIDSIFFKPICNIYGLLNSSVSSLSDWASNNSFVNLVRQYQGSYDIWNKGSYLSGY